MWLVHVMFGEKVGSDFNFCAEGGLCNTFVVLSMKCGFSGDVGKPVFSPRGDARSC